VKMFDGDKSRMTGLPYGEKNYDDMLSRFHLIPERHGQTDGRTDRIAISISRVSVLTRDAINKLRSSYFTIEAVKITTDRHEASRGLFATAELLVNDLEQPLTQFLRSRYFFDAECIING